VFALVILIQGLRGKMDGKPLYNFLRNPIEFTLPLIKGNSGGDKTVAMDLVCENGQAKIIQIFFGKEGAVISLMRTTDSHREIKIAGPGEDNSFYIKDIKSGKTWNLKAVENKDYDEAAGIDLVFDPIDSVNFDLIEGNDTSKTAWHFKNVAVPGK
jgi:hypothetical protein